MILDFGYGVILKGSGLSVVIWDIVGILLFGIALMSFSIWWFRRSLAH